MPYFLFAPEKFSSPRPTYRIGSSIWPSGFLLAKALSEGALFGPETWGYDGLVLRWLHLNCPWEKGSVIMFDLLICAVFKFKWLKLEYWWFIRVGVRKLDAGYGSHILANTFFLPDKTWKILNLGDGSV